MAERMRFCALLALGAVLSATFLSSADAKCANDMNREGNYLNFTGMGMLGHPGTNMTLYSSSLTAEMFIKLEDPRIFMSTYSAANDITLAGNMHMPSKSGWRIGCYQSKCCFQAFVGHHWQAGFDPAIGAAPAMPQEVCSGTLIMSKWYKVAVTYAAGAERNDNGMAKLYVDGKMAASKEFAFQGDPVIEKSRISSEINIDYSYSSMPWHQMAMPTYCTSAGQTDCAAMFGVGGDTYPSMAPLKYLVGGMDEFRLWNRSLTDEQVMDTAYEIGFRMDCMMPYQRVASQGVETLQLYTHDNDRRFMGDFNEVMGPALFVQGGADSVLDAMAMESYIEKSAVLEVSEGSAGVVGTPRYPNDTVVDVDLDQDAVVKLDFVLRDPNYDDVLEVIGEMLFNPDYSLNEYSCYEDMGLPLDLGPETCLPQGTKQGWAVFQGKGDYFGPQATISSLAPNEITGQPFQVLSPGNNPSSCINLVPDPGSFAGVSKTPPETGTQSKIHYRFAWNIAGTRPNTDFWIPAEGLQVTMMVREYQRYTGGNATAAMFGNLKVAFSPEIANKMTIEQLFQAREADTGSTTNRSKSTMNVGVAIGSEVLADDPDLVANILAFDGQQIYLGAGQPAYTVKVRAVDRNLGDNLKIMAREDPGLPPGLEDGRVIISDTMMEMSHRDNVAFQCSGNAATGTGIVGFPFDYELTMQYRPGDSDLGAIYKSCFFACKMSGSACASEPNAQTRNDVCVTFHVRKPEPVMSLPNIQGGQLEAIVGCDFVLPFNVSDRSMNGLPTGDFAGYTMIVQPTETDSQMCNSQQCLPIPGGLPAGAVISTVGSVPGQSRMEFRWKPIRGQEMHDDYKVCFNAVASGLGAEGIASTQSTQCLTIKVRKCMYCVQPGESLDSVARSFKMDFLQLYMSNPYVERPDSVMPGTVLTTGSTYVVRSGDFVHSLSERFLVTPESLLESNPDVEQGGGVIKPGMELCVRTRVCDVDCRYGTDCQLPQL